MSEARRGPAAPLSTHHTFCRICEASCGLEVEVQDNRVTKIRPDAAHPVTKGYACVKGIRFDEVQHAPDRVVQPLAHKDGTLAPTTWDDAIESIGGRLRAIIDEHGPQAVGFYIGNSCGFGTTIPIFVNGLAAAVRTNKGSDQRRLDALLRGVASRLGADSGLQYASAHRAGVNVNALAGDGAENTERLSGMAQLTAFPVQVKPADTTDRSEEQ